MNGAERSENEEAKRFNSKNEPNPSLMYCLQKQAWGIDISKNTTIIPT